MNLPAVRETQFPTYGETHMNLYQYSNQHLKNSFKISRKIHVDYVQILSQGSQSEAESEFMYL